MIEIKMPIKLYETEKGEFPVIGVGDTYAEVYDHNMTSWLYGNIYEYIKASYMENITLVDKDDIVIMENLSWRGIPCLLIEALSVPRWFYKMEYTCDGVQIHLVDAPAYWSYYHDCHIKTVDGSTIDLSGYEVISQRNEVKEEYNRKRELAASMIDDIETIDDVNGIRHAIGEVIDARDDGFITKHAFFDILGTIKERATAIGVYDEVASIISDLKPSGVTVVGGITRAK